MYVKNARIEKHFIKGELYYVLTVGAKYSTAIKYAQLSGGTILGKEIKPSNAMAYLRILKKVSGKGLKIEMKIFIKEKDFLEKNYRYWCRMVVSASGFPQMEIRVPCDNVKLSKEVYAQMKSLVGGVSRR